MDNAGNLLWQKAFGGSGDDFPASIIKVTGGGYVFSAETESTDGDVTGNHGNYDSWVVKINETGTIAWQKTLGGTDYEVAGMLTETADGSILYCSETGSNNGDVTGHHGSAGKSDIWLVKLSSTGTLVWNNCFGGNSFDQEGKIKLLPSGEIYLLGETTSADLPNFHPGFSTSDEDIYFCRISSAGNLLFQKCFGGMASDKANALLNVNSDGSCMIGGEIISKDGDVVGSQAVFFNYDVWVFKINTTGNILWQKVLGGSQDDSFYTEYEEGTWPNVDTEFGYGNLIETSDGGVLFTAFTSSPDGDVTGLHPTSAVDPTGGDVWVVKLSAGGQLEWQRAIGGSRGDLPRSPLEFAPNDYILPVLTFSNDGDIQTNHGKWDAWLVRISAVNRIKGTVFIDQNGNGIKDTDDSLYSDVTIKATKGSGTRTVIPTHGNFVVETDTGSYNISLVPVYPYFTFTPVTHNSTFSTYSNTDSFSYALQPTPGIKDLVINAVPIAVARPGFNLGYRLYYKNAGTVAVPSGEVIFKKDPRLNILNAQPSPSSTVGDTLKWTFTNLGPQQQGLILLNMTMAFPPAANIGDTLSSQAIIAPVAGDINPGDDTAIVKQRIQGSFDPNDKIETLGGIITNEQVASGDYLNYVIRFQNTGTDTAFNVIIRDTLDSKLDWNSFQMVAASHPYLLQVNSTNQLTWNFHGINLPDSNINVPASHGFIAYRIKPHNTLATGDLIINDASIYFDFNLPVATEEAQTIVSNSLISLPLKLIDFTANYQKPDALLEWITSEEINTSRFEIERGPDPYHFKPVGSLLGRGGSSGGQAHYQYLDELGNVAGEKFYYRLKLVDQDNKFNYSNIALVKRSGTAINEVSVNPNPVRTGLIITNINYYRDIKAVLTVTDMQGRVLGTWPQYLNKGYNVIPIQGLNLTTGAYFLQVKAEGKQMVCRFVVSQ